MCPCSCPVRCYGPATPTRGRATERSTFTAIETAYKEFNITVEVIKGSRTIARALPSMVSPGHDFEHEIIGNVTATIMSEIAA
jgi:hypothetical protein